MPAADLWTFTLEDAGTRTLTTRGIRFRRRDHVGPWMTGQAGIQVWVRFMPHHDHRIEVYHAATGRYLGPADLADQATDEQISAVRWARSARARRLKRDLGASSMSYGCTCAAGSGVRLSKAAGARSSRLRHRNRTGTTWLTLLPSAPPRPTRWRHRATPGACPRDRRPVPASRRCRNGR
ncbi:Mu transposase C-terminal domain-containing protein [Streptomyces longwoodensis]